MGKRIKKPVKKEPPKFLTKNLDRHKLALVRRVHPDWLKEVLADSDDTPQMSMDLLMDFIDALGWKSKHFQGIRFEQLRLKDKGTNAIYDYIRKRLPRTDEKTPDSLAKSVT